MDRIAERCSLLKGISRALHMRRHPPDMSLIMKKTMGGRQMDDNTLVESSFSATINAPIEKFDIPSWCFTLSESEYQSCSLADCSAGATTSLDGRRVSMIVEILGGSLIVQHCNEEVAR